jgi:hypothetical protein
VAVVGEPLIVAQPSIHIIKGSFHRVTVLRTARSVLMCSTFDVDELFILTRGVVVELSRQVPRSNGRSST